MKRSFTYVVSRAVTWLERSWQGVAEKEKPIEKTFVFFINFVFFSIYGKKFNAYM